MNDKININVDPNREIFIYDVTLRDGEQASGFHMYPEDKIKFAHQLAKLGVNGIEAGFANSSPGDFNAIRQIANEVGRNNDIVISSLARAKKEDIEAAAKAIEPAYKKRIHTFIATSDIHMEKKLCKTKDEVRQMAVDAVKYAKSFVDDVQFSCEDFGRSNLEYIVDIVSNVINAGATVINLPDTVGYMLPHEFYNSLKHVINEVGKKTDKKITYSTHDHDDFGLSTVGTIYGIMAGADQIEVAVNGIGERAGNASLEQCVAVIKEKNIGKCNVDTREIGPTSRKLSEITGVSPQPNQPIIGENAFSHEAGIHTAGIEKSSDTYEIMRPEDYGFERKITFGPRSGSNGLKTKYESMGIKLDKESFESAYKRFIEIADGKKEIDDVDIVRSAFETNLENEIPKKYGVVSFNPVFGSDFIRAELEMMIDGKVTTSYWTGNNQFDAAIKAINNSIRCNYQINSNSGFITKDGKQTQSVDILTEEGFKIKGHFSHQDFMLGTIYAYVDACNKADYIKSHVA